MDKKTKEEQLLRLKFDILKKTVIEEKEKNKNLQIEITNLKDELEIQREFTSKTQQELECFKSKANNDRSNPKSFFTNLFSHNLLSNSNDNDNYDDEEEKNIKVNEQIQSKNNMIKQLTSDNTSLKDQVLLLTKEKELLSSKVKELMLHNEKLAEDNEKQITDIHKQYEDSHISHNEEIKRVESMGAIIKKLQQEKTEHENDIDLLMNDLLNKARSLETLFKEQNEFIEEIEEAKKKIDELTKENERLSETLEGFMPITKQTVFKGSRISNVNPKKTKFIELTYGEIDKSIVIREEASNSKVFDLNYIMEMNEVQSGVIKIRVRIDQSEEVFLIKFREKYIGYILKYYREGTLKKHIEENIRMSCIIGDYA